MADASRTYHANQAMQISDLLAIRFAELDFGGSEPRILKVTEPDGPSTDGGRKARQSLVLHPASGGGPAIVCGFVDVSSRTAELRTLVVLAHQYQARHNQTLDFTRAPYDTFLQELNDFLKQQGFSIRVTNTVPSHGPRSQPAPKPPAAAPPTALVVAVMVGLVVGFGLGYVVFGLT